MEELPRNLRLVGGAEALIHDLFRRDVYAGSRGNKLAMAVLLSLEFSLRRRDRQDGGLVVRWEGEVTVEHLLPQAYPQVSGVAGGEGKGREGRLLVRQLVRVWGQKVW